jgi:hypothetical protein
MAKINLSTGDVQRWGGTLNNPSTEHIGGLITVNTSGIPYLVEYGDLYWRAYNLNTLTTSILMDQVWSKDPSSTMSNTLFNVAPGIVLVSNSTYSTSALIDVNGTIPSITLATSLFSPNLIGGNTGAFISSPFKNKVFSDVVRSATCSVVASGISVT